MGETVTQQTECLIDEQRPYFQKARQEFVSTQSISELVSMLGEVR